MAKSVDPLITVLMAEYNTDPNLLFSSIRSILDQTEQRFELLLVDDGTTNDLAALSSEFHDDRIRVIGYGENRGFVAALNYGLERARGEFIARMDTDDTVESTYLQANLRFLTQNDEFAVVSARAQEISEEDPPIILGRPGEVTAKSLMRGFSPIHAASMMRREALLCIGGYPLYHRAEDLALWCELLLAGKRLYTIPDVLYNYRVTRADLVKRSIRSRSGEIRARLHYYPKLGAGPREYLRIPQSILAATLPMALTQRLRRILHSTGSTS